MAATKRPTGASKNPSAGTARRKKGRGSSPAKLILYPLSVVAGLWLGVQAYANFLDPEKGPRKPAPKVDKRAAVTEPRTSRPAPPAVQTLEETPKVSVRPSGAVEKVPAVEIDRASTGRPEVALTLDAGADWRPTRQILETLAKEKVRCTFFLTGEWVKENPKTTARIAAEG